MSAILKPIVHRLTKVGSIPQVEEAPKVPWAFALAGTLLGCMLFGIYRWYQQTYSFTVGLDYFEPEFQTYWMRLFYTQMGIIALAGMMGVPLLWFTRDRHIELLSPQQELRRFYFVFSLLAVGSVLVVAVLGIFVEADAAWHQVTVRDTDFTPTHIGLFYFAIPLGLVGLVLGFIWIHTRLPSFSQRLSIPLAIATVGPILIMPNLGLNEWGHTFFYAEELFAAPIHWGFVVLGWSLFGLAGFILQCLQRMRELTALPVTQQ